MAHGIRCGTAKSSKKFCKCSCGGRLHGVQSGLYEFDDNESKIEIFEDYGGEVKKFIKSVKAKEFFCMCGKKIIADNFLAYPSDKGLMDDEGEIWWVYVHCEHCSYDIAYWKVRNRITSIKVQKKALKSLEK